MAHFQKAYVNETVEVPLHSVSRKKLKKHFRIDHFNDKGCQHFEEGAPCEYIKERPVSDCKNCPNYLGRFRFFDEYQRKGKPYVSIAKGRTDLLLDTIDIKNLKFIDQQVCLPMSGRLKLKKSFQPKEHQPAAVEALAQTKKGILKSPPRTGKTVMAMMLSLKLREKTLILLHQDDLADQFLKTYLDFTNARKYQKKGKPAVLIARNHDDFFRGADVVITNYQKFMSHNTKGVKVWRKIAKLYGLLIVDEVHRGNAYEYSRVISRLRCSRTYGMTGTPKRKDGLDFIMNRHLGPVIYETSVEEMKPIVGVYESKMKAVITTGNSKAGWTSMLKKLYQNNTRNKFITEMICDDLERGRSVIVPVENNRMMCDKLAEMINIEWMNRTRSTEQIAAPFYRYPRPEMKKEVLSKARKGELRCIIGMRRMLLGVNVPLWDTMYCISPINNPPNFEQETKRICTPPETKFEIKHKRPPVIRFIVDPNVPAVVRCFEACYRVCHQLGYIISEQSKQMRTQIRMNSKIRDNSWSNDSSQGTSKGLIIGVAGRQRISL